MVYPYVKNDLQSGYLVLITISIMAKKYSLSLTDHPDPLDLQVIREDNDGLHAAHTPPMDWLPLAAIMRDPQANIIAGVVGGSYWGWLYISRVWVKDLLRTKSYSQRLLKEVEREALHRGCGHAFIETQNYDSMLFYESIGYVVVKKTEESGSTRYAMQKELFVKKKEPPPREDGSSSEPVRYQFVKENKTGFVECLPLMIIGSEADALELIGFCGENDTNRLLVHDGNLTTDFYDLHTHLAGDILLKMSNYQIRLAAVIPPEKIGDGHFAEMVHETNRGNEFRVFNIRDEAIAWLLTDL
jgi:GNAT superfamily N-acetyltransferase